jgi:hypothetical protein
MGQRFLPPSVISFGRSDFTMREILRLVADAFNTASFHLPIVGYTTPFRVLRIANTPEVRMQDKEEQLKHLRLLEREYEAMMAGTHDREAQFRLYDMLREIRIEIAEVERSN